MILPFTLRLDKNLQNDPVRKRVKMEYLVMPHLLKQRCNSSTAGLCYVEVSWNCPCSSTGGQSASVRTAIFISSTDFKKTLNTIKALHCKQASSLHQAPTHQCNPKRNNVLFYQIKSNSTRVALTNKYLKKDIGVRLWTHDVKSQFEYIPYSTM